MINPFKAMNYVAEKYDYNLSIWERIKLFGTWIKLTFLRNC